MKISDVAKQYGVSKQAVYQRLKRAGVSVEALTDAKSREITAEGAAIILRLFNGADNDAFTVNEPVKADVDRAAQLQQQVDSLTAEVETLSQTLSDVTAERDHLRSSLTQALKAVDQAQQLQAMMMQRMLPEPRESFSERVRAFFSRNRGSTHGSRNDTD